MRRREFITLFGGVVAAWPSHNPKGHIRISKAHPSLCVQLNHKLTNSLMTEAQLFRNLREPTVSPQSIRNDLEATGFPARGRVPPFRLVLPGKSNPRHASDRCESRVPPVHDSVCFWPCCEARPSEVSRQSRAAVSVCIRMGGRFHPPDPTSQNALTASFTEAVIRSRRLREFICSSSSRLMIEPASSKTEGILASLSTISWSYR